MVLLFYVSNPVREIRGTGDFKERVVGKTETIWKDYGEETVFKSHDESLDFMQGRTKVTLIRFKNLHELQPPVPLKKILQIIECSRMPRNGKYLNKKTVNKLLGDYS